MRQYRGKRVDGGEWVKGDRLIDAHGRMFIVASIQIHIATERTSNGGTDICVVGCHEVVPESVGQSTGKRDVNKQEVFGGDIVIATEDESLPTMRGIVEYEPNNAEWWIHNPVTQSALYFSEITGMYWADRLEVIGNTTDTPKLLESDHEL